MKFSRDIVLYIVVAVVCIAVFTVTFESRKVFNISMLPTIEPGEYIIVNRLAYTISQPERGDVVIMNSPDNGTRDIIKRVIALPGDSIEIHSHTVYVNGTALAEPYIMEPVNYVFPGYEIPEDSYFVLGDNRNNSNDSHKGWLIAEPDIIGKALFTYWPPERAKIIRHYRQ